MSIGELGTIGRDDERTVHGQFVAAGVARPVHGSDHRLRDPSQNLCRRHTLGAGRRAGQRFRQIHSGREGGPGTGDHHHPRIVVTVCAPEFFLQSLAHRPVDGVAPVGPVEREDRDRPVLGDEQRGFLGGRDVAGLGNGHCVPPQETETESVIVRVKESRFSSASAAIRRTSSPAGGMSRIRPCDTPTVQMPASGSPFS